MRVSVSAGCACPRLRNPPFPCLYARLSVKPVPGERLPCVFRGCVCVCVCGAGGRRPVHPPSGARRGAAERSAPCPEPQPGQPRREPGSLGRSGRGAEPGLHPPSQPAGAAGSREPRLSPAPCEVGGSLSPPPSPRHPPPSPSGLQSRRRAAPAAAGSLRPCRGWVFQARHVFAFPQDLPPGRDGGWDGGRRGQEPAGPRRGCGGPPRWENGGCRPREALTGLCLAGCRSWKGCGEGGRRREGPRLHPLFITMQLLRDDFGVKLFTSKWGSSLRGALASGCLGPACINAEQQRSRRKPWDVPQNAQDSHHPCLRCRTEHQWLFFGQYGP